MITIDLGIVFVLLLQYLALIFIRTSTFMMTDSYAQLKRLLLCCFLIPSLIPHPPPPAPGRKRGRKKLKAMKRGLGASALPRPRES